MSNFQARGLMSPTPDPLEIVNKPSVSTVGQSGSPGLNTTPPPPTGMLAQQEQPSADYSNITVRDLEAARLGGNPFSVGQDFINRDQEAREADLSSDELRFKTGIGEDVRQVMNPGGTPRFVETALGEQYRSNLASGGEADLRNLVDQGTANRLGELGLQGVYEQDEYRGYKYNPSKGVFDYYDNSPSLLEQAVPALIKTGIMTAATGGLAAGISAATGVGTGVATGVATGGMTLAQGGDVKDAVINGFTAGLGAQIKSVNDAVKAGTATQEMIAQAQMLNTVKDTAMLVKAVDSGNTLGVITNGLNLAGVGGVKGVVGDGVKAVAGDSEFVNNNMDAITETVTEIATSGLKGKNKAEIAARGIFEYVKNGGGLPNIDLELGDSWDTPEFLKAIDDEALQPLKDSIVAGYEALDEKVLTPAVETVDQLVRDLPSTKEDWENTVRDVNDKADEVIRAIPGTKEDVEDAGDWLGDKAKDVLGFLAGSLLGGGSGGSGGSGGAQATQDEYVDLTNITLNPSEMTKGFEYESLSNPYLRG